LALNDQDDFVEMLEELAPLLAEVPRGVSQEILGSLTGISRLLRDLEVARSELERRVALIEAEQIVASEETDRYL
jgi:hypothetical protein